MYLPFTKQVIMKNTVRRDTLQTKLVKYSNAMVHYSVVDIMMDENVSTLALASLPDTVLFIKFHHQKQLMKYDKELFSKGLLLSI